MKWVETWNVHILFLLSVQLLSNCFHRFLSISSFHGSFSIPFPVFSSVSSINYFPVPCSVLLQYFPSSFLDSSNPFLVSPISSSPAIHFTIYTQFLLSFFHNFLRYLAVIRLSSVPEQLPSVLSSSSSPLGNRSPQIPALDRKGDYISRY